MPAATPGKEYVVGKGRLFFNQIDPDTGISLRGERYFGNTPALTTTSDSTQLEHYDSDQGLNIKDESVTTQNNMTGSFTTDNISADNIALFFEGSIDALTIVAGTDISETFEDVSLGSYYQLGTTDDQPTGARNVTTVVVKVATATITAIGNYEVELDSGRIHILDDAADITAGDDIIVTYDVTAGARQVVIGSGSEIRGALRFISANPIGGQRDYLWPLVKITPNGDFALKGDDWQTLPFNFEVLQLNGATERVYTDIR
jgi:hypothetical protein